MTVFEYVARSRQELLELLAELDAQRKIVSRLLRAMDGVHAPPREPVAGEAQVTVAPDRRPDVTPMRESILASLASGPKYTRDLLVDLRSVRGGVTENTLSGILSKMRRGGSVGKLEDGRWSKANRGDEGHD